MRYVLSASGSPASTTWTTCSTASTCPATSSTRAATRSTAVYLSYLDKPIPAAEFKDDFAPDAKFLYQRDEQEVPERMIRAYQVKEDGKPGPWLAGMTLDPAATSEAWCHQRGYVCFIQELHKRKVKAGETFGAAYVVGWFDDVARDGEGLRPVQGREDSGIRDGQLIVK